MPPSSTADDSRRVRILQALNLLNTDPDPALDRLTRIAAQVTGSPIALVTFVGPDRQWIPARVGWDAESTSLLEAFCVCALDAPTLLQVFDATQDERFSANPLVTGPMAIRFYAGHPIVFDDVVLGTVCVLDRVTRSLTARDKAILADLAGIVGDLLRQRHQQTRLREQEQHANAIAEALASSEAQLAAAQSVAKMGSWERPAAGTVVNFSAGMSKVLGHEPAAGPFTLTEFAARVHPQDIERFNAAFLRDPAPGSTVQEEFRFVRRDGEMRWLHGAIVAVPGVGGTVAGSVGTVQDITDRKLAERSLQDSEERYRLLWQTTTDVVLILDEDSRICFANPALREVFGQDPADAVGHELALLQPVRLRAAHKHAFARYLQTGQRRLDWRAVETFGLHRDGREFPIELAFSDLQISGQRFFAAFIRDSTARKAQQLALHESDERYRRIVQTAEEGIWVIDAAGRTTFANPKMASMLGYTVEEMSGRSLFDFMDERARDAATVNLRRREQGIAEQHDFRLRHNNGTDLWVAIVTNPTFGDDGAYSGALAMVTDITRRKQTEDALRRSEARFRSLTALSSDWYWEQDEHFRFVKISGGPKQSELSGLQLQIGRTAWDVASTEMSDADWAWHRQQLQRHEPFRDFEVRHRSAEGQLQVLSLSGEPVFDETGAFTGYRGVGRNITEQIRARAARHELEAQLRESQKMEAIGVLAGGIAHDFNNVVAGILGNVSLALQDIEPGHASAASLHQIRKAGLRGRDLVQQILAFARRQPHELADCELRPLILEAMGLLRATLPAGVALESELAAEPLHVVADATQIEQVLLNLCTNAWHAIGDSAGRVVIGLAPVLLLPDEAARLGNLPSGHYAHLWVSDSGRGMNAATRARIFEPFFTTKPVGEGTGLGLSVVHGIVAAHAGAITVDSIERFGSTFHVYLPRLEINVSSITPVEPVTATPGRGEHVLYLDDDEVMVLMVERLLQRLGYRVTCFQDARDALAFVRAQPDSFDVAVTDFNMPGISGLEVARELARLRPDLPVVISSGNFPDSLKTEAQQVGVRALLNKQRTLEDMGAVIHLMLSGGHRPGSDTHLHGTHAPFP